MMTILAEAGAVRHRQNDVPHETDDVTVGPHYPEGLEEGIFLCNGDTPWRGQNDTNPPVHVLPRLGCHSETYVLWSAGGRRDLL